MFDTLEATPSAVVGKSLQVRPEFPTLFAQLETEPALARDMAANNVRIKFIEFISFKFLTCKLVMWFRVPSISA